MYARLEVLWDDLVGCCLSAADDDEDTDNGGFEDFWDDTFELIGNFGGNEDFSFSIVSRKLFELLLFLLFAERPKKKKTKNRE